MSNRRRPAMSPPPPSITTTGKRKLTKADKRPFTIDGETFHLIRPKSIVLGQVSNLIDPTRPWNEGENSRVVMQYVGTMLRYIEVTPENTDTGRPTGREWIERRLSDPDDDLDVTDFVEPFIEILQGWIDTPDTGGSAEGGDRPTGSPAASGRRPARSRSAASQANTP